jgi:hypothetical protein
MIKDVFIEIMETIITGLKEYDEEELNYRYIRVGGALVLYQEQTLVMWGEDNNSNEAEWFETINLN